MNYKFWLIFRLFCTVERNWGKFHLPSGNKSAEMLKKLSLLTPVGFSSLETGYCLNIRGCVRICMLPFKLKVHFLLLNWENPVSPRRSSIQCSMRLLPMRFPQLQEAFGFFLVHLRAPVSILIVQSPSCCLSVEWWVWLIFIFRLLILNIETVFKGRRCRKSFHSWQHPQQRLESICSTQNNWHKRGSKFYLAKGVSSQEER